MRRLLRRVVPRVLGVSEKPRPYLAPAAFDGAARRMVEEYTSKVGGRLAFSREIGITSHIGMHFRQTVRVRIERPWWMPEAVYRRLMRTIVVEEGPLEVRP